MVRKSFRVWVLALLVALLAASEAAAAPRACAADLRGFSDHRSAVIAQVVARFDRYLPAEQEIVFFAWDQPGANTTANARTWSVRLGRTTWSRARAEARGYPTFGARTDDELARIVIGHELAHHVLTEEQVARCREMTGGDGEECATVLSMRLQGIPLRRYEQDVSRRFTMYRWCTWFRKYGSR